MNSALTDASQSAVPPGPTVPLASTAMVEAVFWDFGGVITSSPFDNFVAWERSQGLPDGTIRGINATNPDTNAWARYERSDIDREEFCRLFTAEAVGAGFEIPGEIVLECVITEVRPFMVDALTRVSSRFRTAVLTNNFLSGEGTTQIHEVLELFDVVVESSQVGVRKPDPGFYELACRMAEVDPVDVVFLDDLGVNLKPARSMGMTTIKVIEPHAALAELGAVLGLDLTV